MNDYIREFDFWFVVTLVAIVCVVVALGIADMIERKRSYREPFQGLDLHKKRKRRR